MHGRPEHVHCEELVHSGSVEERRPGSECAPRPFCCLSPARKKTPRVIALHPELDRATKALGWRELTAIQETVIPILRSGRYVLAAAQTGSGNAGDLAPPR